MLEQVSELNPGPVFAQHLILGSCETKYTPSFTDIMPEVLEESAQAVCAAG